MNDYSIDSGYMAYKGFNAEIDIENDWFVVNIINDNELNKIECKSKSYKECENKFINMVDDYISRVDYES